MYSPVVPALRLETIEQPYHEAIRTCHRLSDDDSSSSGSDVTLLSHRVNNFEEMPDFFDLANVEKKTTKLLPCAINPNRGSATARVIRPKVNFDDIVGRVPDTHRNSHQKWTQWDAVLRSTTQSTHYNSELGETAASTMFHTANSTLYNTEIIESVHVEQTEISVTPKIGRLRRLGRWLKGWVNRFR